MPLLDRSAHQPDRAESGAPLGAPSVDAGAPGCATVPAVSGLILGLILVPVACAGCIVILYSQAFPSAEKTRRVMMEKALVSCRAALIGNANAPADWRMLMRAPSHASIVGDKISFFWNDDLPDGGDAPRRRRPATCHGTLSAGAFTDLRIDGDKIP
ncbi:hypothetical protein [Burkholderia sp. LMU1-1-1.1]|uniref:hypothetical protein n=1 Tax=Burkholderia sp. LMU1-1-1.1 TaxID=3135266 RepID=UPI00341E39D6